MGEAACVMHAFSYTSGISNEANEGNPMYALEESVSLGRFMSESLSWEKWSSFSRNRYVEEAEMYARPGSVKQKKAYFEAHFKRMAALKAAALLEQASSGQGGVHLETQVIDDHIDAHPQVIDDHIVDKEDDNTGFVVIYNEDESMDEAAIEEAHFKKMAALKAAALLEQANSGQGGVHLETQVIDDPIVEKEDDNTGFVVIYNEDESKDEAAIEEAGQAEEDELQEQFMDVEEQDPSAEMESDLAKAEESCVELEVFHECIADHNEDTQNDGDCELNTKISEETEQTAEKVEFIEHLVDVEKQKPSAEVECELAKMEECHFECSSTTQDGLQAASRKSERIPLLYAFIPSSSPISKRKPKLSSYMPSVESQPSSTPAKAVAVHPGKENTFTPIGRKSWIDDPNKKRTPLRMSINREFNRLISPVIKKMGSSSKASNKDCTTPLKTPAKASVDGMTNGPQEMTPQSGKRRARALFDSSSYGGSKGDKPRWQFLSTEGSKSPSKGKNKGSSPVIPKSFCLSTSRAPRRKERLEEKFNAKATESIQQQSKLKEKPKEVTKLRQSFCFGAKMSSESFREQQQERLEVPKEKSKVRDCQKGSSRLQNMTSLPPRKPETKGTKGCQIKSK